MLIKLKNPQETSTRNILIATCCGSFLAGLIVLSFMLSSRSWTTRLLLLLPIFLLIFLVLRTWVHWRRLRNLRKQADHVAAIDFQPAAVVLKAPCERLLPYAETDFHLRIYTDIIRSGKSSYPNVSKIAFVFQFNGEKMEWEHVTRFGGVFPIVDKGARFAHFSYDVHPVSDRWGLPEYSVFVREQIQNQLCYKAHLPFGKKRLLTSWLLAVVLVFFGFLLKNDPSALYGLPFLVFGIAAGWVPLFYYYRAKHRLNKYRK